MNSTTTRFNICLIAVFVLSLLVVFIASDPVAPSRFYLKGTQDGYLASTNFDSIPESVAADALSRAELMFGTVTEYAADFALQLAGFYELCRDYDTVVIFNPGGFGWDSVEDSPGWVTVMDGITRTLEILGRQAVALDYMRSPHGITGMLSESAAFWGLAPYKSKELAERIDFITTHLPGTDVLITGESNGAGIVEEAVRRLKDNSNVYAIQTGPPVVQKTHESDRLLVVRHNGIIDDSFSHGDFFTIFRSNLEALFGIYQQQPGDIMLYI